MKSKIIKDLKINLNTISAVGEIRTFKITGDAGAKFMLIVSSSASQYYDFSTNTFSIGHSISKTLKGEIPSTGFTSSVVFPAVTGVDYKLLLMPDPSDNTEMRRGSAVAKKISALANTTLTMSIDSTDHTASYKTLPSDVTSASGRNDTVSKAISWTIENAETDANGFGLILNQKNAETDTIINDKAWYFQKTQVVNGTTSSSVFLVLDSIEDIIIGMTVFSGTGLSGKPVITGIEASTNTIKLSSTQSIGNDVTLTFRAIGISLVNSVLDCVISPSLSIKDLVSPTTTVRGANNNDTILEVNGTYGIPGHSAVSMKGFTTTPGTIVVTNRTSSSSAVASETGGELVLSVNNFFKGGEKLDFGALSGVLIISAVISGSVTISKQPTVSRTINLNLDEIIDPGTQA